VQEQAERPTGSPLAMRRFVVVLTLVAVASAACDDGRGGGEAEGPFASAPSGGSPTSSESFMPSASVVPSPTQPAVPESAPATRGAPSTTCVEGWRTPPSDTPLFTDPLGIVRRTAPVEGDFVVVDMRYFTGPESPPSDKGYILEIDRWYIKLYVESDWSYQGRFIVEQRMFGRGVAAVAPYDTKGFRSPDWTGFQWDSADTTARAYPGLPGLWPGVPYDFVKGGAGLEIAGLPDEVRGCLQGT
jgi:hypothetical protein